ncbi:hypothetical protein Pth03_16270 [Planotetraspora thailandica]|uniref:DUF8094 domain-containing protein n=1 Tax=Planotetraspora thailandica TaxID=487172 RepID=A0A8J3XXN8_9ACTN|nr:hypothetical protein [Planotetraspora thailandica]GII53238.1 hypothetical protein Pth03_16270 [Planotetraspora thailandica]
MLRRITTLSLGLVLLVGCGNESFDQASRSPGSTGGASSVTATKAQAEAAFAMLGRLKDAWKRRDCATVASLTTWAENAVAENACKAAKDGYQPSTLGEYGQVDYFLPATTPDDDRGAWFVALARDPEPAYFVFVQADGRWKLGAGPIPALRKTPQPAAPVRQVEDDSKIAVPASLVPTRHVAFLSDPAGVSAVKFASGDRMRDLLRDLVRAPEKVRPDRLSVDVEIEGPAYALVLADGGALVFHSLKVVYTQKPGSGRSSLAHPRYGKADLSAFIGIGKPEAITGSELLTLATQVSKNNTMTTVGMRKALEEIALGNR